VFRVAADIQPQSKPHTKKYMAFQQAHLCGVAAGDDIGGGVTTLIKI